MVCTKKPPHFIASAHSYTLDSNNATCILRRGFCYSLLLQVMGYVAAFKKQDYSTPAAIVITETVVDVLIFPFVDTAEERSHFLLICGKPMNIIVWSSWHI